MIFFDYTKNIERYFNKEVILRDHIPTYNKREEDHYDASSSNY